MKRYLCQLDKIENLNGVDYFVTKCISLDNINWNCVKIKFQSSQKFTINKESLYLMDIEGNELQNQIELNTRQNIDILYQNIINCEHPENNTIIVNILENPDESKDFKYELLRAIIKKHHSCVGWAIDKASAIFPIDTYVDPYFIDIENTIIEIFPESLKPIDFQLWDTVLTHDPEILESQTDQEVKRKFVKFTIDTIENLIRKEVLVFDIEGNKDKGIGWEFAYQKSGKLQYVKAIEGQRLLNKEQWTELEDAIINSQIIAGHNIRKWDYLLLKKRNKSFGKGSEYLKNTWDTIEIELLLNPLRPSFALNAENGHKADNDVRATESLFLQQLYKILESRESYKLVKEYLPSMVVSQIDKYADIIYSKSDFSKHSNEKHNELFYKPVCQEIPELNEYTSGSLLIIAEEDSWQTIFHKFNARFYSDSALDEYNSLNLHKIISNYSNTQNIYKRALYTIANDCVLNGKRLNIKAIPKIIRCAITDKVLRKYVFIEAEPNVICINPEKIDGIVCDVIFDNVLILCNSLIPRCSFIENCNEQIIDIIEEQCEYLIYTQAFPVNVESLAKLGIRANLYREYWISQPVPKEFVVLSRLSEQLIIDNLKKKYPNAKFLGKVNNNIVEEFNDINPSFEEDDSNCIFSLGNYWASRLEAFNKYDTLKPKILIVDTDEQAKSASKYLRIPYALKGNIRKKFDRAVEQTGYNVIAVLQDLLDCDAYDLGVSFCFILNDTAILSKQGKGDHFDRAKEQLKNRLSLFGHESQIQFLGELPHPDVISEKQIVKAEKCFCKEDRIVLTKKNITDLLDWIKGKYTIESYRGLQEPAIKKVIEYDGPNKNFLTILPTGGGKSVIFQGPILYKAIEKGSKKLSLVITPLQALMKDQVKDLTNKGFDDSLIAYINANTTSEKKKKIINNIKKHKVCLLYISPERLMNRNFFQKIIRTAAEDQGIDSIIFDEAHCITAWGMDFRSDYILALRKCLELQKAHKDITIQMFTATLPWRSKEDLKAEIQFGENDCNILPVPDTEEYNNSLCPIRKHIELQIKNTEANKEEANTVKLTSILKDLDERAISNLTSKSGRSRMIVFTYSRSDAEESAEWLKEHIQNEYLKERISYFHARIERHEKERRIRQFMVGQILILCSTKAFGLGMNIPNIHYVFHLTPPTFIEDYLQEVGRAARKTDEDNYTPYEDAFPIENGKRKPVKAICYYTQSDIENRLERIQRIYWEDIHDSFEYIKEYVSNFKNPKGHYIIPVDLLASKERNDSESKNKSKSKDDDLIEKFEQCLGWLSKPNGLNRIQLGFRCPDSYDLGFDSNIAGISKGSQLYALIKYLKEINVIQKKSTRIIIQANSIIGNPFLDIDSIEDLESIIDEGVRLGVFNRNFMYISISLRNKKYLMDFIEKRTNELNVLSVLCESLKDRHIDNFNLTHSLDEKLDNISKEKQISDKKREYIKSVIAESWNFFVDLNEIYTVDEIEANCKNLIREIGQSKAESVSWSTMEKAINAQADTNKLKLFINATSKLSYTTKGSANTDFIEILILDKAELDENTDSKAKEEINNFYLNKQSRAGAMCGLLETFKDSEITKEVIREYSKCQADKIDELPIVAGDRSRVSARKGLEDAVKIELNDEQRKIYNLPANQNINVIAGAGSGKTRLLIYRALKLILDEGTNESKVLILAYNRAVRDEVEKRMAEYASSIRCPLNDMKIYTFHGYASICIPDLQNNRVNFDEWERSLLQDLKDNPEKYKNKYRHILIDEFQDVTTTRLEIIKSLLTLNTPCNAFVIGDMFQSIYGYEKKKDDQQSSIEPLDYYEQLNDLRFSYHNLSSNYRSYKAIIKTAQQWFEGMAPEYTEKYEGHIPNLESKLEDDEYVQSVDANGIIPCMQGDNWKDDLVEKILIPFINNREQWAENHVQEPANPFSSIGILFRTNSDVQDAFQWLNDQRFIKDNKIEVRIQGSDIFYSSTREFYFFERELKKLKEGNATEDIVKKIYAKLNKCEDTYDKVVLDVAQELALYILNKNAHNNLSCKELAEKFNSFARAERNHLKETLDGKQNNSKTANNLRIIVSTIHRVKGLEFDAVVIPASKCSIGFGNDVLNQNELNMEERRLMYVAFSRAKRMLFWYKGDRERAILTNSSYAGQDGLIYADDGQSKVDTAYLSISQKYEQNNYIRRHVKIGDRIYFKHEVYNYNSNERERVKIIHIGSNNEVHHIGNLSRDNSLFGILRGTENLVSGYYVKSVNVFSYQDEINNPERWCQSAIDAGFVYYIDYYGCINLNNGNGEQN